MQLELPKDVFITTIIRSIDRTLFDSIDEGFCTLEVIFDENGEKAVDYRFLEMNAAFERQTGIENGAGRRMREVVSEHEEFWFEIYGHIARTGEARRFEHAAAALTPPRYYESMPSASARWSSAAWPCFSTPSPGAGTRKSRCVNRKNASASF